MSHFTCKCQICCKFISVDSLTPNPWDRTPVTPKENNEIPKPFIFCGACDDAGDVDGSTDRVIALDQSSV